MKRIAVAPSLLRSHCVTLRLLFSSFVLLTIVLFPRALPRLKHARLKHTRAADALTKARASWCRDVADVLLHIILATNNSQRMRSTAIHALNTLGQLQEVHLGVWLAPMLEAQSSPLISRRFVPVKVRSLAPLI